MTVYQCKLCAQLLAVHKNETPEQAEIRLKRDERPVPTCQYPSTTYLSAKYATHVWRGVVEIAFFADREYRGEYR